MLSFMRILLCDSKWRVLRQDKISQNTILKISKKYIKTFKYSITTKLKIRQHCNSCICIVYFLDSLVWAPLPIGTSARPLDKIYAKKTFLSKNICTSCCVIVLLIYNFWLCDLDTSGKKSVIYILSIRYWLAIYRL